LALCLPLIRGGAGNLLFIEYLTPIRQRQMDIRPRNYHCLLTINELF
jgi:hypothetical protein